LPQLQPLSTPRYSTENSRFSACSDISLE